MRTFVFYLLSGGLKVTEKSWLTKDRSDMSAAPGVASGRQQQDEKGNPEMLLDKYNKALATLLAQNAGTRRMFNFYLLSSAYIYILETDFFFTDWTLWLLWLI